MKINLAKCKIGQRVRLRNGEVLTILKRDISKGANWPIQLESYGWYNDQGVSILDQERDIVAILPLPKKKAKPATHMGRKVDIAENRRSIKATIQNLKNAIKHLEGLI